jgi:hypothetical protein
MSTSNHDASVGQIAFYAVELSCEAAPHIACGIRAKPILASLRSNSLVSNAWFGRSGTTLAIDWAGTRIDRHQEAQIIRSALSGEIATATRIVDAAVVKNLQHAFAERHAWYRKDEIDELSEDLDAQRQEAVRRVVGHACAAVLTTAERGTLATREKLLTDAILNAACCELQPIEVEALRQAIAHGGHRPVAGEG